MRSKNFWHEGVDGLVAQHWQLGQLNLGAVVEAGEVGGSAAFQRALQIGTESGGADRDAGLGGVDVDDSVDAVALAAEGLDLGRGEELQGVGDRRLAEAVLGEDEAALLIEGERKRWQGAAKALYLKAL